MDLYPAAPPGLGTRLAHDPGDPLITSHCPFCGSGQVIGRSDGTIGCDFCGQNYIVRVQPAFPGSPQAPAGPGAPSDIGPDGGVLPPDALPPDGDPSMMGPGGAPEDDEDGGNPFAGDDDAPPDEDGSGSPEDDDEGDDAPPPPPKGKSRKKGSYRSLTDGELMDEDTFARHVAARLSGCDPAVLAAIRSNRAAVRHVLTAAQREAAWAGRPVLPGGSL